MARFSPNPVRINAWDYLDRFTRGHRAVARRQRLVAALPPTRPEARQIPIHRLCKTPCFADLDFVEVSILVPPKYRAAGPHSVPRVIHPWLIFCVLLWQILFAYLAWFAVDFPSLLCPAPRGIVRNFSLTPRTVGSQIHFMFQLDGPTLRRATGMTKSVSLNVICPVTRSRTALAQPFSPGRVAEPIPPDWRFLEVPLKAAPSRRA